MRTFFIVLVGAVCVVTLGVYHKYVYVPNEPQRLRTAYVKHCLASALYYNQTAEPVARDKCRQEAEDQYPKET